MILLEEANYKNIVSTRPNLSSLHKLPIMLDTETRPDFQHGKETTPFFKIWVVHVTETTEIYDANNRCLRTVDSTKLYVHSDLVPELIRFIVCKRLAVTAILGCELFDHFVVCVYPKARLVGLMDASIVPAVPHYEEQRSAWFTNSENFRHQKHNDRVSDKIHSKQQVRIPTCSQVTITEQNEWEDLVLATPKELRRNTKKIAWLAEFRISNASCPFKMW